VSRQINIYSLHHPESGELRYVGKTVLPLQRRLRAHIGNARRAKKSNHTANWIQSLKQQGLEPDIRLIDQVHENEWQQAERDYISLARMAGCRLTYTEIARAFKVQPSCIGRIGQGKGWVEVEPLPPMNTSNSHYPSMEEIMRDVESGDNFTDDMMFW
jgi:hypothetical protein